jgi:hypothetical protein
MAPAGCCCTPDGNTAFEAAPFYTDDMLDEIERLGGIRFLASSHVHGYGALWQLQDVFQPEVLAIQKEDLRLTKAFRVTWPYDDALELMPGPDAPPCRRATTKASVLHDAGRRIAFLRRRLQGGPGRGGRTRSPSPPTRPSTSPSR